MLQIINKFLRTCVDTLKDPHLLSSRPHHEEDINKYCPDCGDYIMPLDWCGCTDPTDANYKGECNLCLNCGNTRMKCKELDCPSMYKEGWTCSQCQIRHTPDMKIGHCEIIFEEDPITHMSKEILLCEPCCDDLNHQGLSDSEKESIGFHQGYDDLVEYLVVRSDGSWEYSGPEDCPTHCAFPDDIDIKVHQQRIGNFLVTIQEVQDESKV